MANDAHIRRGRSRFSFKRLALCGAVLGASVLLTFVIGGAVVAVDEVVHEAKSTLSNAQQKVSFRIDETYKLLESLAEQPVMYDPAVPIMDKVRLLDQTNVHFGYFLICYVDADINVWDKTGPASLASRDYMQKLYSTRQRLVMDSFAAGADGVTLNYVVAVPLFDAAGSMSGSLFASLYFNSLVDVLNASLDTNDVNALLIGSKGQVMSSTGVYEYGENYLEPIRTSNAFGVTADHIEEELRSKNSVAFWTMQGLDISYHVASPVEGTEWDVVCVVSFWQTYAKVMMSLAPMLIVLLTLIVAAFLLMRRLFAHQMGNAQLLERSVVELERKIYSDERPDDADIADILELTSSGLTDGLTGVVTRPVFSSRLATALAQAPKQCAGDSLYVLCFIDLDDFKNINDTYGHATGDVALKTVGYLLREYERRYEGLVGRYGGDEFVLLMTDIDDEAELRQVLDEMVESLHMDIQSGEVSFVINCSIGVSVWNRVDDADGLIAQADKSLYRVKETGKKGYLIHQDGEPS